MVNEDPVDPQSRTVTEPQREAPPKQAPKTSVFWGFFLSRLVLIFVTGHKVDTVSHDTRFLLGNLRTAFKSYIFVVPNDNSHVRARIFLYFDIILDNFFFSVSVFRY